MTGVRLVTWLGGRRDGRSPGATCPPCGCCILAWPSAGASAGTWWRGPSQLGGGAQSAAALRYIFSVLGGANLLPPTCVHWVPPCHQGSPGGCAGGLHIALLQDDPSPGDGVDI